MTVKRFTLFTLIGAMIAALVLGVSAQDGGFKRWKPGFDGDSNPILEATGLDEAAVHAALNDGSTLAELIEANGGDVDSVIAAAVAQAASEVNERVEAGRLSRERADAMLEMLEVEIAEGIHGSFDGFAAGKGKGRRGRSMPGGRFGFDGGGNPILEATGLDEAAVYAALKDGSTLAELIEANGGDVDSVIEAVLADIEAVITEDIHSGFDGSWARKGRHGFGGFGFWDLDGASKDMDDMDTDADMDDEDSSGG